MLLARTGTLTVALLAGDIGQSGLVPGQEQNGEYPKTYKKCVFDITAVIIMLLARTGILTVALLAGDIGQSGLVPGQEHNGNGDTRLISWGSYFS